MKQFYFSFDASVVSDRDADAQKKLLANKSIEINPQSLRIKKLKKISKSSAVEKSGAEFLQQLQNFHAQSRAIYSEFKIKNPFSKVVEKALKSENLSSRENQKLREFCDFSEKVPTLALIRKFLVEFPKTKEFDDLRFYKNLLEVSLNLPRILENPHELGENIIETFHDFHKMYTKKYTQFLKKRCEFLGNFWRKNEKILRQKIFAAQCLSQIEIFSNAKIEFAKIKVNFEKLRNDFCGGKFDKFEIQKALEVSPFFRGVSMNAPDACAVCTQFTQKLDDFLQKYFAKIASSSVLQNDDGLSQILNVAEFQKIVSFFNAKTASILTHELRKILTPKKVETLNLGDFAPQIRKVKTKKDAQKLVAEFAEFLKSKKRGGNLNLT